MNFLIDPLIPVWGMIIFAVFTGSAVYLYVRRNVKVNRLYASYMRQLAALQKDKIKTQGVIIDKLASKHRVYKTELNEKDRIIEENRNRFIKTTKEIMDSSMKREKELINELNETRNEIEMCRRSYSQLQDLVNEKGLLATNGTDEDPFEFGEAGV